jgi:ribose 5-phosphate isomerase B
MKKIALGTDHAGFTLKEVIKDYLEAKGYEIIDYGTHGDEPVDYPDYIRPAAQSVADGENELGIVFGGSGNGEAMVANKVKGIRCGLCWNEESARLTKEHNNANMIALGARMVSEDEAMKIVDTWLKAEYQGGRHQKRIDKIEMD